MEATVVDARRFSDEYELLGKIGAGGYGVVHSCRRRGDTSDRIFAVKEMHQRHEGGSTLVTSIAALREVKLLRELSAHPNVVKLVDVFLSWEAATMHLVFELATFDLARLISDGTELGASEIKEFMFQLLCGVEHLHANWVIHRDLKPENILVDGKLGQRRLIIADFGLARIFQQPVKALSELERVVATLWYRAPELLLGSRHYTKAVDVWALGCIFGEMWCKQQLFMGVENKDKGAPFQEAQCRILGLPDRSQWVGVEKLPEYRHIQSWRSGFPRKSMLREHLAGHMGGRKLSNNAYNLMECMLQMDPAKRISASDALKHPYFQGLKVSKPGPCIPSFVAQRKRRIAELEAVQTRAVDAGADVGTGAGAGAGVGVSAGTGTGARAGAGAGAVAPESVDVGSGAAVGVMARAGAADGDGGVDVGAG